MARGLLEVQLIEAKGLGNAADYFGKIDPYVLIQYNNQEQKSNVAQEDGGNPVWNEKHTFQVDYPVTGSEYKLKFRIMDRDRFSADDFVGESVINIKDLLISGIEKGTAEICPTKYVVFSENRSYNGELEVGVIFTPKVEEVKELAGLGGWKQSYH
ncbi:hypothetical protein ACHQM5_021305 [Ranunculus cassubicifolius]